EPDGRAPRQLRQGAVPGAVLLHAVRADGGDPGGAADGLVRPRLTRPVAAAPRRRRRSAQRPGTCPPCRGSAQLRAGIWFARSCGWFGLASGFRDLLRTSTSEAGLSMSAFLHAVASP